MISNKELLFSVTKKDFIIQTFRSGGKGGQNQNKVESGVRLIHKDSGAVGESREERSQLQNKKIAFRRLIDNKIFKDWMRLRTGYALKGVEDFENSLKKEIDTWVEEKFIKIDYYTP